MRNIVKTSVYLALAAATLPAAFMFSMFKSHIEIVNKVLFISFELLIIALPLAWLAMTILAIKRHGRAALWLLVLIPVVFAWPVFIISLQTTCAFSSDCD